MSEMKNTENQTKKLLLQRIVDGCIIVLPLNIEERTQHKKGDCYG